MNDEDDDFDGELAEYSPKSDFSKAKIVGEAITKCIDARGKEMKAGYYNVKLTKDGDPIKIWVEDSRQIFIGTVIALKNLLSPEIKYIKSFTTSLKELDEKIKTTFKNYQYTEKTQEKDSEGRMVWKDNSRQIIPEIDDIVIIRNPRHPTSAMEGKGYWNLYVNAYWNELVKLYDEIFAELNNLIGSDEINYFKTKSSF